jgi:hypothetical protein
MGSSKEDKKVSADDIVSFVTHFSVSRAIKDYAHAQPSDAQPSDALPSDALPSDAQPSDAQPATCQPQRPSPQLREPFPCLRSPDLVRAPRPSAILRNARRRPRRRYAARTNRASAPPQQHHLAKSIALDN